MRRLCRMWVVVVALGATLGVSSDLEAFELYNEDEVTAELGIFGQAVGGTIIRSDGSEDAGFYVPYARMKFSASYAEHADLKIQIGGAGGDVVLKDAAATLWPVDGLGVRAGRYKTSVSLAYQISSYELPFIGRTLLNGLVPNRRIGAEVLAKQDLGEINLIEQVGLFQPVPGREFRPNIGFSNPQGQLLTGRVAAQLDSGLTLHASYAQHVFGDNEYVGLPVEPFNQQLDTAIGYTKDRLDLLAEGVAVFDPPSEDVVYGGYLHALYEFGAEDDIQVQPGLAYDILADGDTVHRGTVGVNIDWWEAPVQTMFDYRLRTNGEAEQHAILVSLRAGET